MSEAVSEYIVKAIIEIHKREKTINKLYIFEKIPPEKLRKAMNSYASSMGRDEAVIFFYDDTVFGSANEGFILTTKRLYYKNIMEKGNSIDIADILTITLKIAKLTTSLAVTTASGDEFEIQITTTEKNALCNVLDKTIGLLKNANPASAPSTGQAAPSRSPICRGCGANNAGNAIRCEYCDSLL